MSASQPAAATQGPPPQATAGGPPPGAFAGATSGFEGRETELGEAMSVVLKTLADTMPYPHEMNDALVKSTLMHIQFAKQHGLLKEIVEHDIEAMAPLLKRIGGMIEKTGQKDMALVGIFDRTTCHYQLVASTESEPGMRRYHTPYGRVLEAGSRLGQFDLTEAEIHEVWTKPRYLGYAAVLGVEMSVSDVGSDGAITVRVD